MNSKSVIKLIEYINKYGYFHNGVHYVDYNGKTYNVNGMMKTIQMMGIIP